MSTEAGVVERRGKPDSALAAAVDVARAAAVEEATSGALPGEPRVGEHLGVIAEGERIVTHRFRCTDPAYRGWVWTVQLSRVSRGRPTVDDVVLLPDTEVDGGAMLAPAWVPFEERVRPGDVGVGDLLPTAADDERLAVAGLDAAGLPGPDEQLLMLTAEDVRDLSDSGIWLELGLGRPRVLSAIGRVEAAQRWWDSEPGPDAAISTAAPAAARCASCGFWLRLVGELGTVFGACTNVMAPDDGRVVAGAHGCGAHSEAVVRTAITWAAQPVEEHTPGSVMNSTPTEPYGHS
ncbi:MAG TPA: DUF3027 domain-containing protein [Mycobacteriales bacterium]|nr:DUF3027 domain-containing protein [Mycobacteriales bacterium]